MYRQAFDKLDVEDKDRLQSVYTTVTAFNQSVEYPLGLLTFPVTLSDGVHSRTEDVEFLVMEKSHPSYDLILGREAIGDFNINASTAHGMIGLPTPTGVALIRANAECFTASASTPPTKVAKTTRAEPEKWPVNGRFPDQTVTIGPAISEPIRAALKRLLMKNTDVFAWTPADMTGVPRSKAEHELKVNPAFTPVVQKRRKMGPAQNKACNEQVVMGEE